MEKNAYSNTDSIKYAVGTVNVKAYKDRCHLQWKIKSYFFRYHDSVTWFSSDFKMWDEVWKFSCKPWTWIENRPSSTVLVGLGSVCHTKVPNLYYSFGILKGDGSICMSTELTRTKTGQTYIEDYFDRNELFNLKYLIAPDGNVTFFMDICIKNRGKDETSGDEISKGRSKHGTGNEETDSKDQPSSEEEEHDNENKEKSEFFDATDTAELTRCLKDAFVNETNSDLHLKVGQRDFKAHKMILSARSTVFATMFEHDMVENRSGVIDIPDCDPDAFREFLLYLYTANVDNFSESNVTSLYYIADKYDVKQLALQCLKFMVKNISAQSFCDIITLAVKHSESELIKTAEKFFAENVKKILVTVRWQSFIKENPTIANELFIKCANQF